MAKSKIRFNTPRIWTAHEERVMREDDCGGWVRLHDYNELLYAYRGALAQLDRAAKRIAGMKQTASNALAQADAACGVSPGATGCASNGDTEEE